MITAYIDFLIKFNFSSCNSRTYLLELMYKEVKKSLVDYSGNQRA